MPHDPLGHFVGLPDKQRTVRSALGIEALAGNVRRIRKEFPDVEVIVVSGGDSTGRLDLRKDADVFGAMASLRKPGRPSTAPWASASMPSRPARRPPHTGTQV